MGFYPSDETVRALLWSGAGAMALACATPALHYLKTLDVPAFVMGWTTSSDAADDRWTSADSAAFLIRGGALTCFSLAIFDMTHGQSDYQRWVPLTMMMVLFLGYAVLRHGPLFAKARNLYSCMYNGNRLDAVTAILTVAFMNAALALAVVILETDEKSEDGLAGAVVGTVIIGNAVSYIARLTDGKTSDDIKTHVFIHVFAVLCEIAGWFMFAFFLVKRM